MNSSADGDCNVAVQSLRPVVEFDFLCHLFHSTGFKLRDFGACLQHIARFSLFVCNAGLFLHDCRYHVRMCVQFYSVRCVPFVPFPRTVRRALEKSYL